MIAGSGAHNGQTFANGIYLQGNNTLTFAPIGTETIAGVIGDDTGSAAASGYGGASGYTEGSIGVVVNGTGTLKLAAANTFAGGITLHSGAVELAAPGAAGSGSISFTGAAVLVIDPAALNGSGPHLDFATSLDASAPGATIDLPGLTFVDGGSATPDLSTTGQLDAAVGGTTVGLHFAPGTDLSGWQLLPDGTGGTELVAPCFAAGTHIATARGQVAAEDLREGDIVPLALGGNSRVVWLGHRTVDCARHPRPWDVHPVRVQAGAFGRGKPGRDLYLSPDHAVFAGGALIPVRYLLNGRSIAQTPQAQVTYWHVELERHAVLLAEGLPCESFLDTGNRAAFANGGPATHLHPDFALRVWQADACAKLVREGGRLAATRRRLLRHAQRLGHALTPDPGLVVAAAGRAVPLQHDNGRYQYHVPSGTRTVRLLSRVWTPAHTRPDETDTRALGVAIGRLWLDGRQVGLDSPGLSTGWHAPEPEWRWTTGDAALELSGARSVMFELAMTGDYWRDQAGPGALQHRLAG